MAVSTLAEGLRGLGHRVEHLRPPHPPLPLPRWLQRVAYNLRLPRRVAARKADLAVGFDVDGVTLSRRRDLPLVVSLKGVAADEARFERGPARWHLRGLAFLEARNARAADRVVVPSRYSARVASRAYGLAPESVRVVPEALPPETRRGLRRVRPGDNHPEGPTVLSVARQYPRKNTETLIRAFPRLLEAVPGARLRVVGGGPRLPALRRLVAGLDAGHRIRLTGPVADRDDVLRAYASADCFCLPSLQEGFGIVFLEAMAAGLPVVAGRAGAVPEVVADGETGILVDDPADPGALATALARILSDRELARRMGRAGRSRVERFTPEAAARRFEDAVAGLLRPGAPEPR